VDKDEAWEAEYLKAMEQAVRSCSKRFDVTYANSVLDEDEKGVYVGQEEV
jgi:lipoate-protein ligase B